MDLRYELTEDDVVEANAQLQYVEGWRTLDEGRPLPTRAQLLLYPLAVLLYLLLTGQSLTVLRFPDLWLVGGLATSAALLVVMVALPLVPRRPMQGALQRWLVRRRARRAIARSVLGPVVLRLDDAGITRTNARGEDLHHPWAQLRDVLVSPRMLTLRLRGDATRILGVPTRAFADGAALEHFVRTVEAHVDAPRSPAGFDVPAPARPPSRALFAHARLRLLTQALVLSLCLFGLTTLLPWLRDPTRQNPPGAVVLYSAEWCGICTGLRACLTRNAVPFDERDIDRSERARLEYDALDASGVPVVLVGQEVVHGWNDARLRPLLAQAGHHFDCGLRAPAPGTGP